MNVTEEQLQQIIARAIKEILGDTIDSPNSPATSRAAEEPAAYGKAAPAIGEFDKEELQGAMDYMAANRGKDGEPKVGIFWYDPRHKELFGVRSHLATDYAKPNSRSEFGGISCSEMHEDVWKHEYHKQKYKNGGVGPYVGAYEDTPRGRIFYNPGSDTYTIAVGSWIHQHPEAIPMIEEEFNLSNTNHQVKTAYHWDIGQRWE